jgi:O-antigen ligase
MMVGMGESLYGMFEFFSGYHQILYLENSSLVSSVTGTFVNPNFFAGYLLMVIPLSVGYLLSREANRGARFTGWRNRLSALDGKTLLIGFGIIVMILGFLFSASRMGILSLLLSFSLITLFFKNPQKGQRFSKTSVLIFTLAFLWAAWIGLDAVIGRFFSVSEDFKWRWTVWVNTFQILKDFPLLGSGLGTFERVFPMYQSFYGMEIVDHAENDFLQMASETGLIGAGLLLILFVLFFYKAVSGIRSLSHREPQRYIGIGGMVGIMGLMLHSIVETNIQIPSNAFLYAFLFAMVLRVSKSETKSLSH